MVLYLMSLSRHLLTAARDYGKLGCFIVSFLTVLFNLWFSLCLTFLLSLIFSSTSCSSSPSCYCSQTSFTPYLNYFLFPLLSGTLSSLHLSHSPSHPYRHPSLPILIALCPQEDTVEHTPCSLQRLL